MVNNDLPVEGDVIVKPSFTPSVIDETECFNKWIGSRIRV